MNNPDTTKFLQLAAGDLADARRMVLLQGFRDSSRTNRYASLIGLGIFAVQLRYDDQPDLPMPPWADMLDLVEQLLQEVESTTEVDLNKGLFGVPDWEDWTT